MVDGQIHTAGVVDERLLAAFSTIPRELFVPEKLQSIAYTDEDLDIGQGRYLIEPIVHAKMLQAAAPNADDIVLDIGAGGGYSSAILAPMVTTVISVENNKRQMDKGVRAWKKLDLCNIVQVEADLKEGVQNQAPYSLICINGAVAEVPQAILDQLSVGGRLITVVRHNTQCLGKATLFMKNENGTVSSKPLFDAGTPFLEGFEPQVAFQF